MEHFLQQEDSMLMLGVGAGARNEEAGLPARSLLHTENVGACTQVRVTWSTTQGGKYREVWSIRAFLWHMESGRAFKRRWHLAGF